MSFEYESLKCKSIDLYEAHYEEMIEVGIGDDQATNEISNY